MDLVFPGLVLFGNKDGLSPSWPSHYRRKDDPSLLGLSQWSLYHCVMASVSSAL